MAGQQVALSLEDSVAVDQQTKARLSFRDKQVIGAAMVDVQHADWPAITGSRIAQKSLAWHRQNEPSPRTVGLFELERDPDLGINTSAPGPRRPWGDWDVREQLLVFGQNLVGLIRLAQADQDLAEVVVRGQVIGGVCSSNWITSRNCSAASSNLPQPW